MAILSPRPEELLDLGGGMIDGIPASHLQPNQFHKLRNMRTLGTKLSRRGGARRITTAAYTERVTSLFAFKLSAGSWTLMAGTLTGLARLVGTSLVQVSNLDSRIFASDRHPWQHKQRNDLMYLTRRNAGTLKRSGVDFFHDAGIPAPTTALVLSDGGAGGPLPAGTWRAVYTYFNTFTNAESDPSPVSNALTLVAGHSRSYSGITTSLNQQVNARRVYLTLVDSEGTYFFGFQIEDNYTTSYAPGALDVVQDDLGDSLDLTANGLPPDNLILEEVFDERLFVSDGSDVFFSAEGKFESYDILNDVVPFNLDDGHVIRALHAHGSRLIVGKTDMIHYLTAAGPDRFAPAVLSDEHGVVASESMRSGEGLLFWYSGDNIYRAAGADVVSISTIPVRRILDRIPAAMKEYAVGSIDPAHGEYHLAVSQGSLTQNELELVYNYKTDSWSYFDITGSGVAYIGLFYDTNYAQVFYGALYDNHIYQLDDPTQTSDDGVAIVCQIQPRAFTAQGRNIGVRHFSLLTPGMTENATFRTYDAKDNLLGSRTVSLEGNEEWKQYNFDGVADLKSYLQPEIEYTGLTQFELEGILLDLKESARRGVFV